MIPGNDLVGDTVGSEFGVTESEERNVPKCCRESIHDSLDIKLEPYALR